MNVIVPGYSPWVHHYERLVKHLPGEHNQLDHGRRIKRIIGVADTREIDWATDKPIPGSGDLRQCERCGRDHEIHVNVELESGDFACIGSGCAKGDTMEAAVRGAVSASGTLDKLKRKLERARRRAAELDAEWNYVQTLPFPSIEGPFYEKVGFDKERLTPKWKMGDAEVWGFVSSDGRFKDDQITAERKSVLEDMWRARRFEERTGKSTYDRTGAHMEVRDLERRIERQERKLHQLMQGN